MTKKSGTSAVVLTLVMLFLVSCATLYVPPAGGSTSGATMDFSKDTSTTGMRSTANTAEKDMLDKLRQIKPDWTTQ